MCSLCNMIVESSFHLFFECPYAINLWNWLSSLINNQLHLQSRTTMWNICNRSWNPQCRLVITAAMINIIYSIWHARNHMRFSNRKFHWKISISNIISSTALTGNLSKVVVLQVSLTLSFSRVSASPFILLKLQTL